MNSIEHLLSPNIDQLHSWAERISLMLQERGLEVLNVSEKRPQSSEYRIISITLTNDTKGRHRQIELVGSYSTRRVMRIVLMRDIYVSMEERPMFDVETEVEVSLKKILNKLQDKQLRLNLTDPN